jgi:SAM-dependent methyltransferase
MGFYGDVLFPWLMDAALAGFTEMRRDLLAQAAGRTLEIGAGSGLNLPHYPRAVTDLTLLTPDFPLPERLKRRMALLPMPHRFVVASAEALPYPDASFDTVVATLVFCTIPDAAAAAAEVRRVLKPAGRLITLEHVRSQDPGLARWQRRLDPVWERLACGCHLDRDAAATFAAAGLRVDGLETVTRPGLSLVRDFVRGTAAV